MNKEKMLKGWDALGDLLHATCDANRVCLTILGALTKGNLSEVLTIPEKAIILKSTLEIERLTNLIDHMVMNRGETLRELSKTQVDWSIQTLDGLVKYDKTWHPNDTE